MDRHLTEREREMTSALNQEKKRKISQSYIILTEGDLTFNRISTVKIEVKA